MADQAAYEHKLGLTRACFSPTTRVLEFGCGTGSTAIAHAPAVASYTASDVSPRMIAIGEEKARGAGIENIRFVVGTLQDIDPAERFDAVLALNVLHLVPNYADSIRSSFERLDAGGVFVSSTPALSEASIWLRLIGRVGGFLGLIPRLAFFSSDELRTTIRAAGFEIQTEWQPKPDAGLFLIAKKPG